MFSLKTCIEIVNVIDLFDEDEIERIYQVFKILDSRLPREKISSTKMANTILGYLQIPNYKGPFTNNFHIDMLEYLVDDFYRFEVDTFQLTQIGIEYDDLFSARHKLLANSLKRDGYIIKGQTIKKMLPEEIEEAKIESLLFTLLKKYQFDVTLGHLKQAIDNHQKGHWAGANSQFRTFIESLLVDINNYILPGNKATTMAQAMKLLTETANPPFLIEALNEVTSDKEKDSFIQGFWVRLHPEGSHRGLSDEQDSSFRYHISIVFANYLLNRLESRK